MLVQVTTDSTNHYEKTTWSRLRFAWLSQPNATSVTVWRFWSTNGSICWRCGLMKSILNYIGSIEWFWKHDFP